MLLAISGTNEEGNMSVLDLFFHVKPFVPVRLCHQLSPAAPVPSNWLVCFIKVSYFVCRHNEPEWSPAVQEELQLTSPPPAA